MSDSALKATPLPALFAAAVQPIRAFVRLEAAGGILLFVAALAAMLWANVSPASYDAWFSFPFDFAAGGTSISFTLREAINDGLMAIFFFVVGMEIKRELSVGELSTLAKASLPAIAAVGGMVVPAAIFVAFNHGGAGQAGWGVPMATDIAFCVGLLALVRKRVPHALVIFLTALAIFDDIGGILVIALFYGSGLSIPYLAFAGILTLALVCASRRYVTSGWFYALIGAALWYAVHHAGVHATIAGVILGVSIPARQRVSPREVFDALALHLDGLRAAPPAAEFGHAQVLRIEQDLERLGTPVERFLHALHPLVAFVVLPLFAIANSGIPLGSMNAAALGAPVTLGIAAGLFLGKPLGILGATLLAVSFRLSPIPGGASRLQLFGVSIVAGIGFTVALFIASLAYANAPGLLEQAKLGIVVASVLAGVAGFVILRCGPQRGAGAAMP